MKKKRRLNEKGRRKRRRRIIRRIIRLLILLIPVILICMIGSCARRHFKKEDAVETTKESTNDKVSATIISAGDIIMHGPFLKSNQYLQDDGTYIYDSIFKYVNNIYKSADLMVVNFENTIAEDNYTSFPLFRSPSAIAASLANNGVDLCLLANNHIYDNSSEGLIMTQAAMDENNLLYTGVYRENNDEHYKIVDVNGIKIGIFNYVFETGNDENGLPTINSLTVSSDNINLIDTFSYDNLDSLYDEIKTGLSKMSELNVEYTIAYLHWGTEYQTAENDYQKEISQNLCDLGIDALIGGHPHVIQPVDLLQSTLNDHEMLCVYSIGNHLSNQQRDKISSSPEGHTEDGLMVKLILERENGSVSLTNVEFIPTWNYRTPGVEDDENPEFYIFPITDPEKIVLDATETSNLNIESQIQESSIRTNEIIGEGVIKIQQALPIIAKRSTE